MDIPIPPAFPEPTPFFVDRNITAYVIPIFSSADPAPESIEQELTPTNFRKRKRSLSPNYARKRPSDPTDLSGRPVLSESILTAMKTPDFRPETLTGEVASEWREFIIRTMFPITNLPDAPSAGPIPPNTYIPKDKRQKKLLFRPAFTKDLKIEEGRK